MNSKMLLLFIFWGFSVYPNSSRMCLDNYVGIKSEQLLISNYGRLVNDNKDQLRSYAGSDSTLWYKNLDIVGFNAWVLARSQKSHFSLPKLGDTPEYLLNDVRGFLEQPAHWSIDIIKNKNPHFFKMTQERLLLFIENIQSLIQSKHPSLDNYLTPNLRKSLREELQAFVKDLLLNSNLDFDFQKRLPEGLVIWPFQRTNLYRRIFPASKLITYDQESGQILSVIKQSQSQELINLQATYTTNKFVKEWKFALACTDDLQRVSEILKAIVQNRPTYLTEEELKNALASLVIGHKHNYALRFEKEFFQFLGIRLEKITDNIAHKVTANFRPIDSEVVMTSIESYSNFGGFPDNPPSVYEALKKQALKWSHRPQ